MAEEVQHANHQHARRFLYTYTDEDGMLVIRGRLPPAAFAKASASLAVAVAH